MNYPKTSILDVTQYGKCDEMGRKRLEKPKARLKLSVDADLLEQLEKDGVNKSRLFSIAAKKYLRRKQKNR